jgi:hypothetical protein
MTPYDGIPTGWIFTGLRSAANISLPELFIDDMKIIYQNQSQSQFFHHPGSLEQKGNQK